MVGAGVIDSPDHRSSHSQKTPTAAGVGLVAALGAGTLYYSHFFVGYPVLAETGGMLALSLLIAALGLIDDVSTLRPGLKAGLMMIYGGLAVWLIGPPQTLAGITNLWTLPLWFAVGGAILWMFVITNTVNFMDGINGIMGSCMATAFTGLTILAFATEQTGLAMICGVLAAAILGFLPYNLKSKSDIFCGDVGSLLIGFVYGMAVLALVQSENANGLIYTGVLFVLPFLADVLLTLLYRLRRGANLLSPHRDHLYQRLTQSGVKPMAVTLIYWVTTLVLTTLGLWSCLQPWPTPLLVLVVSILVLTCIYGLVGTWIKTPVQQQNPRDG